MNDDLDRFKREIDLRSYAASQGYEHDPKNSCKGSFCMRHAATDDKIFIKLNKNGHYNYFSAHRDEGGTIVDFVKRRQGLAWRELFDELRAWIGQPPMPVPVFSPLPKTVRDRSHVENQYARMNEGGKHPYLVEKRAIPGELLESERFAGRVRVDARGNAIFPHFDQDGLCGYEIKNQGFTGFSSGGTKGLWLSHTRNEDNRQVFCESAIDALSYAALCPHDHTRYASIGGKPNALQPDLITAAVLLLLSDGALSVRLGTEVVAAMDNDADGSVLCQVVRQAVQKSGRDDVRFVVHQPFGFKDWNDQLRAKPLPFLSYRPDVPSVA